MKQTNITYPDMMQMIEMFRLLNDEQKDRIFTAEQKNVLSKLEFFDRIFNHDVELYKKVETAIAEEAYAALRAM